MILKNLIKKIISPIIYGFTLFPLLILAVDISYIWEAKIGFASAGGVAGLYLLSYFFGALLFLSVCLMMGKIDKSAEAGFLDHARQSIFYYFTAGLFAVLIIMALRNDSFYGADAVKMFMIFTYSLLAIITNAVFLYIRSGFKKTS